MSLSERLATAVGSLLERRISRRSALTRAAVAGSAFAVAPSRYLFRPGTAWAVIRPRDCDSGLCRDGYTAFCCEIEGGSNACPSGTYVAGWWKCSHYRGSGLCHGEGVRYYLDCNRTPDYAFPGGCQCANGDCAQRRVDCNRFRYGQCNTHIRGTTEVVCRLVICQHPATVDGMNCNATAKTDDRTCSHEALCLEGLAGQLPGGGGA
ncbi:MAG: twin-arginine translocation signal domain-containing protein [Solirubrobacterales bacterium]|nr:twin-arginine translocation signal domain-containing protein [Solirubrobacterales bacterium]MBV9919085.1 twin-arginine translocation signal domain-containing protein [Solirubrobacterales bacterium]